MARLLARRNSKTGQHITLNLQISEKNDMNGQDPHTKLIDLNAKYVVTSEILGSGTSAVVKRATRKDDPNVEVAVKIMNTTQNEGLCDVIQNEFDLMKKLRHPNIIQAYELFVAPDRTLAGLCMELVRGSTLKALVQKSGAVTEDTIRPLFKQLIAGISYLHCKRIIHRDLKPDNLLVEENLDRLRICDFNVARRLAGGCVSPLISERQFTAPEVLLCDPRMGERSDIWGAGVCLYYALTGGKTFASVSGVEHYSVLQLGRFLMNISEKERSKWIEIPGLSWDSHAVNVVWGCTHSDVSQRPEPSLLMAHPWLSQIADVPGQKYVKNLHTDLPADAMETCAIRVCSIGFGSAPNNAATLQSDARKLKCALPSRHSMPEIACEVTMKRTFAVDDVPIEEIEDVGSKTPCMPTSKSLFWTQPAVDNISSGQSVGPCVVVHAHSSHDMISGQCDGEEESNKPPNNPCQISLKENAVDNEKRESSPCSKSPVRFAISKLDADRRVHVLDLYAPDQHGLLSVLCEMLMSNRLDVEHANIVTENGVAHNQIWFHVPVDDEEAEESMHELEDAAKRMCRKLANEEIVCDFAMQKTLQHYVNPDLLRVTSFQEIPSNDSKLHYEVGIEGIDQAGVLAYTSVLFARCRFSIRKASISTKSGHISDLFELSADSLKAIDLLRSQLDLPGDNQFREEDRTSLPFSSFSNGGNASAEITSVHLPNGDEYQGGIKESMRHGYGMYKYQGTHNQFKQYKGQWSNDMKQGYGVLTYKSGNVYVGHWEENLKNGIGVMFMQSTDLHGFPSFKYEGQWVDDVPHGFGAEESHEALYYGKFNNGLHSGPGVDLKHNKISECKVRCGSEWLPLIEALQCNRSQKSQSTEPPAGNQSGIPISKEPIQVSIDGHSLTPNTPLPCLPWATATSHMPTPKAKSSLKMSSMTPSDNRFQMQTPTTSTNLQIPKATQYDHRSLTQTPIATSNLQKSEMTPCDTWFQTSPPAATAAFQVLKNAASSCREPQKLVQEDPASSKDVKSMRNLNALDLNSLATPQILKPHTTIQKTPPEALDLNSFATPLPIKRDMSRPTFPAADISESGYGESPTHFKVPVRCPTLWGENELAAFVSCLGIDESVTNQIRQNQIKGAARLLEKSNADMHNLGLTDPVQRLVVRKALQRLLEIDRSENIFVGQCVADVLRDPVLCAHIIPLEAVTICSTISQGGFGKVYRGMLRPYQKSSDPKRQKICSIALKEMKGEHLKIQLHELLKEAHVLASLHHKNVCRFLGVCASPSSQSKRYIISELLDCSLFDLIHNPQKLRWHGDLNLEVANSLSIDMCDGIRYLHNRKLVHADLKSSNILMDLSVIPIVPKICDFGHAAIRPFPAPHSRCGTPHWAAPEALRGEALSEAADMYSFGVIFWETITKKIPHHTLSIGQILATVGWAGLSVDLDLIKCCPEGIRCVIEECLANTPSQRPTARITKKRLCRIKKEVRNEALSMLSEFFGS